MAWYNRGRGGGGAFVITYNYCKKSNTRARLANDANHKNPAKMCNACL